MTTTKCTHCSEPITYDAIGWHTGTKTGYLGDDGHRHEPPAWFSLPTYDDFENIDRLLCRLDDEDDDNIRADIREEIFALCDRVPMLAYRAREYGIPA